VIALAVLFTVLVAVLVTIRVDTDYPRLREIAIPVEGLDREIDMLQVSDLGGVEFGTKQSRLAALLEGRDFDSIVLTGDMLGQPTYQPIWDLVAVLKKHSNRIRYVPGNHDSARVATGLAKRGVPSLPASATVALSPDSRVSDVALVYGRSSASISTAKGKGRRLLVIASHTPPDRHRLAAGRALGPGAHLYIAGHTHGGQIRLPLVGAIWAPLSWPREERDPAPGNEITFLPELKDRFVDGMYVRDGQRIFVSRGLDSNTSGVRFLCRAELVAFRFVPSAAR
jgi:uncharacterized protein